MKIGEIWKLKVYDYADESYDTWLYIVTSIEDEFITVTLLNSGNYTRTIPGECMTILNSSIDVGGWERLALNEN